MDSYAPSLVQPGVENFTLATNTYTKCVPGTYIFTMLSGDQSEASRYSRYSPVIKIYV